MKNTMTAPSCSALGQQGYDYSPQELAFGLCMKSVQTSMLSIKLMRWNMLPLIQLKRPLRTIRVCSVLL